jgi:hypothetical protein
VLRLWLDEDPRGEHHVKDIVRFNEAIDQAVAESVSFFSAQVDRARDLFLGMLGHDMRSPLQTIQDSDVSSRAQREQRGDECRGTPDE